MVFAQFTDFLTSVRDRGAEAFNRIKDRTTFNRTVWACFLIGRADGNFDASEKQATAKLIQSKLPQYTIDDILAAIDQAEKKLNFDVQMGTQELLDEIGKAKGEAGEAIIRAACYIGAADGDFDDQEKAIVRQLCSRMELNPANYGL